MSPVGSRFLPIELGRLDRQTVVENGRFYRLIREIAFPERLLSLKDALNIGLILLRKRVILLKLLRSAGTPPTPRGGSTRKKN